MVKNYLGKIGITVLAAIQLVAVGWYIHHDLAQAYVRYGPAAQLNAGDIKSLHILDGTILGADISSGASTTMNKFLAGELTATSSVSFPANSITDTMVVDTLTASNYLANSSYYSTTTHANIASLPALTTVGAIPYVSNSSFYSTSTLLQNGIKYTFPATDGSANNALLTNGGGTLSWGTTNDDWQQIGETIAEIATSTIRVSGLPARKDIMFKVYVASNSISSMYLFKINPESTQNYDDRWHENNGADTTDIDNNKGYLYTTANTDPLYSTGWISGTSTSPKLIVVSSIIGSAAEVPASFEYWGTWNDASNNIANIEIYSQSGTFGVGSRLTIYGKKN